MPTNNNGIPLVGLCEWNGHVEGSECNSSSFANCELIRGNNKFIHSGVTIPRLERDDWRSIYLFRIYS